jgi:site-specific recombinase XerD
MWNAGLTSTYAMSLKPNMLAAIVDGYGCWLGALAELRRLDQHQQPADRVTADAVSDFLEVLRDRDNSIITIRTRLSQLGLALRILAPQTSFTWLHPRKLLHLGERPAKRLEDQWAGWPAIDRQLWERALAPGDLLDEPNYAFKLRPATLKSIITGYRRWLVFLTENGLLDPDIGPAARVTPANVRAYFACLRGSQSNASVIQRMSELRQAMRIMHPEVDFRWLTSPRGRSLASLLPIVTKPVRIIDSKVLYEWGLSMMRDAPQEIDPEHRRIEYRNGLLIAIFAARAPRVTSMASLRLGESVRRNGSAYRLVFTHEDIKTGRHLEYDTPVGLTAAIDHYIAVVRAELITGQDHGLFWVNQYGAALSKGEISDMIQRKSKETFGHGFGPHRFRHALGTSAPLKDPAHPGVAAAVLGISGPMVEQHYNRATQADVAEKFGTSLGKSRAEHRGLAGRAFGWEPDQ